LPTKTTDERKESLGKILLREDWELFNTISPTFTPATPASKLTIFDCCVDESDEAIKVSARSVKHGAAVVMIGVAVVPKLPVPVTGVVTVIEVAGNLKTRQLLLSATNKSLLEVIANPVGPERLPAVTPPVFGVPDVKDPSCPITWTAVVIPFGKTKTRLF
jgi:hypothetical protein